MSNQLKFSAILKDDMSRAAKAMAANLRAIPQNVHTTYKLNTYANVSQLVTFSKWMNVIQQRQNAMNTGMLIGMKNSQKSAAQMAAYSASVTKSLDKAFSAVKTFSNALQILVGVGLVAGIAGIAVGFTTVAKKIVSLNSEFETFQTSLRTTLGSLAAAKKEMKDIIEFARVTPYEIAGVTDAFVKLRAYALDPNVWATAAGDMAAAFGKPMIKAVEAIADASRGEFKRLREFGFVFHVNDFKKGGQQAGKTYAEAVFEAISGRFKGGMKLQSQTYAGIVSNLKDTITIAMVEAGKPIFEAVKVQAQKLLDIFDSLQSSGKLTEWVKKFQDGFARAQEIMATVVSYIQTNWLPIVKSLVESVYKVGKALVDVFAEPVVKSVLAIVTAIGQVVAKILELVTASDSVLKVLIIVRALHIAFKTLSIGIKASATEMVAMGKATSTFSASAGILTKRLVGVAAAMLAITGISKATEFKNNIKGMATDLGELNATGLDRVKKEIIDIAEASGKSNSEIARAGVEATKFGDDWDKILTSAAMHAEALGKPVETLVNTIGELAVAFKLTGDDIEYVATELERLQRVGKTYNVDTEAMLNNLTKFPELLQSGAYKWEDWVDLMSTVAKNADDLKEKLGANYWKELLSGMDLARTPSLEMLIGGQDALGNAYAGLDNSAFITQSIENAKSLEDTRDSAKLLEDTLREVWATLELGAEEFDRMLKSSDNFDIVINTLQILDKKVKGLELSIQSLRETYNGLTQETERLQDRQTQINITLSKSALNVYDLEQSLKSLKEQLTVVEEELQAIEELQPTGTIAFNKSIENIEDNIDRLNLKSLRLELLLLNDGFKNEQRAIDNANRSIKEQERALKPLELELKSLEDQFTAISDAISKAQGDLDRFTNPKLKGMGEFDDKLHSIDSQLTELERKRLDVAQSLKPFESAGLTGTDMYKRAAVELEAIDQRMQALEDARARVELDRKLAYDDQLYQLQKIGDREKEITFEDALKGATGAVSELEKLEPQLDIISKQKDAITEILDKKKTEIERQQELVDQRQEELDIQKEIINSQKNEIDNDTQRLSLIKQIAEAERNIALTQHNRIMEALKNGPVVEASTSDIQSRYRNAADKKAGLKNQISTVEGQIKAEQNSTEGLRRDLMVIGIDMAEAAQKLVETQRLMDQAENDLVLTTAQIKSIVTGSASIITGIDPDAFMKSTEGALRTIFGDDYFGAMDDIINRGGLQQGTVEHGGPVIEDKGPGFMSKVSKSVSNTLDKWWTEHPWATGILGGGALAGAYKAAGSAIPAAAGKAAGAVGRGANSLMGGLISTNYQPLADVNAMYRNGGYDNLIEYLKNTKITKNRIPKWLLGEGLSTGTQIPQPNLPNLPEDLAKMLKKSTNIQATTADIIEELTKRIGLAQPPKTALGRIGAGLGKILPEKVSDFVLGQQFIPEVQFNEQLKQIKTLIADKAKFNPRFARAASGNLGYLSTLNRAENTDDILRILEETPALKKLVQKGAPNLAGDLGRYSLATRQVGGAIANIPLVGKPTQGLMSAIRGPGGVIPRLRRGLYSSASLLGTGNAVATGEGVPRAIRYLEGQQAGGVLSKLQRPFGVVSPASQAFNDIADAARGGKLRKPFQLGYDFINKVIGNKSIPESYKAKIATEQVSVKYFAEQFEKQMGKLPSIEELTKHITQKMNVKPTAFLQNLVEQAYSPPVKGTGIKGFVEKALPKAKDLKSGFKKWTSELPFNQIFDTIGEKLAGKGGVKAVGKGFSKLLKFGLSAPVDIATGSYDLQKLIRKIPGWDEFLSSDKNPFVKLMDGLFKVFGNDFGAVFLKITDPIESGAKALEKLIQIIEGVIEVVIKFVFGVGKSLYEFFKALFTWNWDDFGSKIKGAFSGIWDTIAEIWENMKGFWTYFTEYWGDVWSLITAPFEKAWSWISSDDGPKGWPVKVWTFISGIGEEIGKHLEEAISWVSGLFGAAWNWVSSEEGPKGWPTKVWGFIINIAKLVVEKAGEFVDGFKQLFGKVWDWISSDNGPKGWPSKVVGWISSIPQLLLGLGDSFFEAGKAAIEKIGDGMSAAWEWLKTHVPGLETLLSIGGTGVDLIVRAAKAVSPGFMDGGIATGPITGYNATLHGREAIIPLKAGYIPVKITGDTVGGTTYKTSVVFGEGSIVVRDNSDIDKLVDAIKELQKGSITFSDKAFTYTEAY